MVASHHSAPILPALPADISGDYYTELQWQVLFALLDAVVPSIVVESAVTDKRNQWKITQKEYEEAYKHIQASTTHPPDLARFEEYLRSRPAQDARFVQNLKRTLDRLPHSAKKQLGGALNGMATKVGSFILTGYCTPVPDQPLHIRHAVLQAWKQSWFATYPILARSMVNLAQKAFVQTDPLFKQLINYTDYPADYRPGPGFDFKFMQFEAGTEPAVVETDIVIVGSGCGGGVCAKVLSEAGHRVVVVDKGYYYAPSQFPMDQETGCTYLFENQGFIGSDDNSVNVIAGSCWGGGGTVNWSVSLQTQGYVRKEWAEQGLPFFTSPEFQDCLQRVCDFMGVSDAHILHNHGARVVLDGARKLGWEAKSCPQNTAGQEHYCGQCHFGCGSAGKQGPAVSWLPAASKSGAQFIEGFHVSELLFDESSGSKKATGLVGTWTARDKDGAVSSPPATRTQRTIRLNAKKVIVAAGSLQSPLVLLRSGLKNRWIGRNLHLHPSQHVIARFDEDVKPWEGGIITSYCTMFENLDGQGHGVKLETMGMQPYMTLATVPWISGLDFKLTALKFRNMNGFIALTRDRDSGRVFPDPVSGEPRIEYTISDFDRAHTLAGVTAIAKLCYTQGAQEIFVVNPNVDPFRRAKSYSKETPDRGIDDAEFVAWLATLEKAGNKAPFTLSGSAHQMGTCRMSSHAGDGVVNPRGRVWEAEHLYVADASVFPSASGVNPMVTNMAIADWIARGIARELSEKIPWSSA